MQVAPIRSPIDMLRAQSRLKMLGACTPGSSDEIESAALRDAIEHYRCVTETLICLGGRQVSSGRLTPE